MPMQNMKCTLVEIEKEISKNTTKRQAIHELHSLAMLFNENKWEINSFSWDTDISKTFFSLAFNILEIIFATSIFALNN